MTMQWIEGDHHGLVWPKAVAIVSGVVDTSAASDIWSGFGANADLARFLKLLSATSGSDLLSLPDFAIAIRSEAGWQLAARGSLEVQLDDREPVRGAGISTWTERRVESGDRVVVRTPGDSIGVPRPLVGGLVPASELVWGEPTTLPPCEDAEPVENASLHEIATPPSAEVGTPLPVEAPIPEPEMEMPLASEPETPLPGGSSELPLPEESLLPSAEDVSARGEETRVDVEVDDVIEEPVVAPASESAPVPEASKAPVGRFARQYGDTQLWSVEDAAVRPGSATGGGLIAVPSFVSPTPSVQASSVEEFSDHDGATMMLSSLPDAPVFPVEGEPDESPAGPTVLAVLCDQGHPNPPQRPVCSECGGAIVGKPRRVARPSLGRLALPGGDRIDLTAPVIVGRKPRADRVQGTVLPRLVPLSQGHVSGNHLEFRLEEWNVLAVDLHSTNGTYLRRIGEAPVRLGERPELLVQGDVLDLGHGVQLTLEFLR